MEVTLKQAIDYGVKLHQIGELIQAEAVYDEILTYFPEHPDVFNLKGVIANQKGDFKKAIELISKAISNIPPESAEHPLFSSFYQNLANAYLQNSQISEAEENYKKAIELQPENLDAKFNYSRLLRKKTLHSESIKLLNEILEKNSTYINAVLEKADIYYEIGEYKKAKENYEIKLDVDSFDLEARIGLGKTNIALDDFDSALDNFEKASKLGTNLYEPYFWLGFTCDKMLNYEKAAEYYEVALYINPNFTSALINLSGVYTKLQKLDKAEECKIKASKLATNLL